MHFCIRLLLFLHVDLYMQLVAWIHANCGMDPCLVFGLGSMLASEILWHMLHHRTMPFRIDYGFRVFGMAGLNLKDAPRS